MAKIVAFANQKGGVAKTTTTLNMGAAVQELGRSVLLVDLDPQGNLTMSMGLDPDSVRPNMYDVLTGGVDIEETIAKQEVDLAVANIDLAAAELALSSLIGRERALSKALFQGVDGYDSIFIDTVHLVCPDMELQWRRSLAHHCRMQRLVTVCFRIGNEIIELVRQRMP